MTEELQKYCRICLDLETDHVSIIGDPTIHLHLKSCLAVTISPGDNLPKSICASCVSQLAQFYNFQLNARCSQDWLESSIEEKSKKCLETKTPIQPLPDSEYNSDSLLEFLNNTANIEEYLNNLGKEDIPSIVNLLDRNEKCISFHAKDTKVPSPKKKSNFVKQSKNCDIKMEIDVLDSDIEIVQELLIKETEPKEKNAHEDDSSCFACGAIFNDIHKLTQHMSVCDAALRTCVHCKMLFDSKIKMQQHLLTHNLLSCKCGKQFQSKEKLIQHHKTCLVDYGAVMGCLYRCKECGLTFKERFQLYKHARRHVHKSEEKICDICGHSFIGNVALTKHKLEEHEKSENLMYRCKVCSITSSNRKEMYLHVKSHTFKQESSFHLCESCGCNFSTHSSLLRHLTKHEKMKNLQCNVCSKYFTNDILLKEHKSQHSKIIICERCGQTVNGSKIDLHCCK
ncbi:unnamed protein product [Chilo suppressalis]|uniref:Uncharacterized protein n=1 Tax=Chilo suppressalis TaxID=168631 RepID=A0ABN8L9G7_CHISP|nr:unnamed protein product [Chilo suppressalis]